MDSVKADFPQVKSIKVIVEERRIDLELNPGNWRTHVYSGLDDLPARLAPAFATSGSGAELDLAALIRNTCASGKIQTRFELPYTDGEGPTKKTVLRSVLIHLTLRCDANAAVRRRSRHAPPH